MKFSFLLPLLVFFVLPASSRAQDSLVNRTFLGDRVQLLVPKKFQELSKDEIEKKFSGLENKPSVMLTDSGDFVSMKIIVTSDKVSDKEVGQYKGWRVSRMLKDSATRVVSHDYRQINGKNVGIIKVIYPGKEEYSHYFFTSYDGLLLLVIVDCIEPLKTYWEKSFDKMMNSLIVR